MSQSVTQNRIEPIIDPGPTSEPAAGNDLRAMSAAEAFHAAPATSAPAQERPTAIVPDRAPSTLQEQLARLEDKTSRIEEKLSRSESATARVVDRFEASSHRMNEIAQQSELMAVRSETKFIARQVRGLPGFPALLLSSVVTAVLTAILTVLIIRFLPGLVGK